MSQDRPPKDDLQTRQDATDLERDRLLEEEERNTRSEQNYAIARIVQVVYYLVGALTLLLLMRFVLRITAANPENQVYSFIKNLSDIFVIPFDTLFSNPQIGETAVFDLNALIAIITYGILGWLVARALWTLFGR